MRSGAAEGLQAAVPAARVRVLRNRATLVRGMTIGPRVTLHAGCCDERRTLATARWPRHGDSISSRCNRGAQAIPVVIPVVISERAAAASLSRLLNPTSREP